MARMCQTVYKSVEYWHGELHIGNVGQIENYKSKPISGKISFVKKGRPILAASLLLALAVSGLFLSLTPNPPERVVIISKPANARIVERNYTAPTDTAKGTSTQEAQTQQKRETQQNATANKTTNAAVEAQVAQKQLQDKALADRINTYLVRRGSPMAGTGATFVAAGNATGVNPILSVAIAGKESSFGLRCFAPRNAYGMKALEYCNGFASWEEGIWANSRYLLRHYGKVSSPYQCQGYCVPDHPWMEDVASTMSDIQSGFVAALQPTP